MKQEYRDWFIENSNLNPISRDGKNRRYTFSNIIYSDVPFHDDLKEYIFSLNSITKDSYYKVYHIHTWDEGDFFKQHTDNNGTRKWTYVCELKPSICNTKLLINGSAAKEGLFDIDIPHSVPYIQEGTRISLTVFGLYNRKFI